MRHNRKGFTLIELIIVITIIGVLMVIAVPILSGAKTKAICAEAANGIGTLRTAFRNYYAEYQRYPDIPNLRWLTTDPPNPAKTVNANTLDALGLTGGALGSFNGRYFSNNCYLMSSGIGGFPGGPFLNIYVFTDPLLWTGDGGTANTSQGGQSGETQAIVDLPRTGSNNYGLIYVNDTSISKGRIRNYKITKSGF